MYLRVCIHSGLGCASNSGRPAVTVSLLGGSYATESSLHHITGRRMAPSRIPFFNHSDHQHDPNRRDSSYHTFPERQEPHRPDSGLEEPTLAGVARAAATAAGLDAARPTVDQRSSQQKFQTAARRAMSARKMLSYKKIGDSREPGVDARKVDLPDLHQKLVIQAVDFSRTVTTLSCPLWLQS